MSKVPSRSELRRLVDLFAQEEPMPAGGAAGLLAIALGAALGIKVRKVSARSAGVEPEVADLEDTIRRALLLFEADIESFDSVVTARRRDASDPDRPRALEAAWQRATRAPVAAAQLARRTAETLRESEGHAKPSVRADLAASLALVTAGGRIATDNARDNARRLDPAVAQELLARLEP